MFLFLWMFLVSTVSQAQSDSVKMQINLSDSTGFGTPDGKLISKEIGADGGQIASEDGRVELIFPTGALVKNTVISIQPRTNLAPNGVGKSYWFEPSGIQFEKPVQINFRYTDEEANICPPDWMSLGIQDHMGKWTFIDYESFDSVSKTLKGFIHHFSAVSNISDVRIVPEPGIIRVNEISHIALIDRTRMDPDGIPYGDTTHSLASIAINSPVLWYVNGVLNGNDQIGRHHPLEFAQDTHTAKTIIGRYKAPRIMSLALLDNDPVTISAEIYRRTRKGKVLRKRLSTSIVVYDEYDVSVNALVDNTNQGAFTQKWTDTSTFKIIVGYPRDFSHIEISDIRNNVFKLEKENFTNNHCTFVYENSATCIGPVHVAGISGSGISGGSADTYVTATVDFIKVPWDFPKLRITCRGLTTPSPPYLAIPAFPHKIKFQLKPGTVTEQYSDAAGFLPGGKISITIKQVTER